MRESDPERLVGAERVLAVLVELARHPDGISLDDLSRVVGSSKPTVHRALASLRRMRLADQPSRGVYLLGDEFLHLAFAHQDARPEATRIEPALRGLAKHFGETAHYAVLDGPEVVYRAKVDPPIGSVRLTSVIGGRNPAHRTAVGKLLLSRTVGSEAELRNWLGDRPLDARTPKSITSVPALWAELAATRERGYGVDDQENEIGINCLAVPVPAGTVGPADSAVSISALAFRLPLADLVKRLDELQSILVEALGSGAVASSPSSVQDGPVQRP